MSTPPTLTEVKREAAKAGLPSSEARKFFHYYHTNGWKVGRRRMANLSSALVYWKMLWAKIKYHRAEPFMPRYRESKPPCKSRAQREVERISSWDDFEDALINPLEVTGFRH